MEGGPPPARSRAVVAVVPFGATVEGAESERDRAGRWARQLARRLVERLAGIPGLEAKPVFLVAMPETTSAAGYLVFGSTPDAALAAEYGRSLEATHVLTGTYREDAGGRRLAAALVDVAAERATHAFERDLAAGQLHRAEPALAAWLVTSLGMTTDRDLESPATANERAYAALLVAMDAEVDATLLRDSDAQGSWAAITRAVREYAEAARADPASDLVEERVLVMAATAMETDQQRLVLPALDALADVRPRSWRVHYMLGEVRRTSGDASGAIVALEHADALRTLRPEDSLGLARLHLSSGAPAVAASRLRRLVRAAAVPAVTAAARRLLLGIRHPELEQELEAAGKIAVEAEAARYAEAEAAFGRVLAVEPDLWEAHFGRGLIAWQRGDAEAAQRAFDRAMSLNPGAADLLAELRSGDA